MALATDDYCSETFFFQFCDDKFFNFSIVPYRAQASLCGIATLLCYSLRFFQNFFCDEITDRFRFSACVDFFLALTFSCLGNEREFRGFTFSLSSLLRHSREPAQSADYFLFGHLATSFHISSRRDADNFRQRTRREGMGVL